MQTRTRRLVLTVLIFAACGLTAGSASAQLTDATQTFPVIPGGQIGKSLEQQVGAGRGDELTFGSSIFLIKRDPARSVRRGRQLFQRKFTQEQGFGPRVSASSSGDIGDNRALGAGLVDSCAGCHGRPRGSAGFGGNVVTRPDSRDAPHLFGLGLVEMLADEMTAELRAARDQAVDDAANGVPCDDADEVCEYESSPGFLCRFFNIGCPDLICEPVDCGDPGTVTRPLTAKGVEFGVITAFEDGTVDLSGVEGVDEDLRVRPFFHQGGTVSMREFIVGAFKAEMGLESPDPLLCAVTDPVSPVAMTSPSGMIFDPELDTFERPPVCDATTDGDGDGVVNEIDPALVDHLEFYLLNYFKAGQGRVSSLAQSGLELMRGIGCTTCHRESLVIDRDRRVADVQTEFDAVNGIFNRLFATATTQFEIVDDGQTFPQLLPNEAPFVVEKFFSDLKRHDLGPAFHEREYDGTLVTEFVTEPLWGVGSTSPYGHDGRSINLEEVILRHGGEAQGARDAFASLSVNERRSVTEFLSTLVLFPPDDTASNLNPGNPATNNPQDPAEHGNINLGVLFQIADEGPE